MTAAAAPLPNKTQPELIGFVAAAVAHLVLVVVLSLATTEDSAELPPAMEVSFVEETGPVSTAPVTSAEPMPTFGEEQAPAEEVSGADASAPADPPPEPVVVAERTPSIPRDRPEQALRERRSNQPTVRREVTPPRPTPPRPTQPARRPQNRPAPTQPRPRSFAEIAESIGRATPRPRGQQRGQSGPPSPSAAPANRPAATSQQRNTFVAALTRQIARCSSQQRLSTPEARSLRPIIVIRLREDGSLDGAPVVRSVEGVNDSNRQYERLAREAIVRAIRQCAPYSGLPAELYSVPNGWRQPPPIRMTFQ